MELMQPLSLVGMTAALPVAVTLEAMVAMLVYMMAVLQVVVMVAAMAVMVAQMVDMQGAAPMDTW